MQHNLRAIFSLVMMLALLAPNAAVAGNSIETQQYTAGQSVQATDLSGDNSAFFNVSGLLSYAMLGTQNAMPNVNPLTATLSGSAMTFTIGGGGQMVLAQDSVGGGSGNPRIIDSCPFQTITIPSNSTGITRTDTLSIQYQEVQTNPHTVPFSNGNETTVYNLLESCTYNYGAATTSPPSGYVAFATFSVPNGATNSAQATVTYLFPTMASQLKSVLGGFTSSVNGIQGPVTLSGGSNILITPSGSNINISVNTTPTFTGLVTASAGIAVPVAGVIGNNQNVNNQLSIGTPNNNTFLREFRTSGGQTEMATGGCTNSGIWCLNNYGGTGSLLNVDGSGNTFVLNNMTAQGIVGGAYLQFTNSDIAPFVTTIYGDGSHSVAGINANVFGVLAQSGAQVLASNNLGDLGVGRNIAAGGSLSLGSPLAIAYGGTGTASPSLSSGSNTSISGSWPAQAVNVSSSPIFSGTATAQYLNMSGNGGGYATAGFPIGVAVANPKWVSGTGTASTGGTSNSYPNGFAFSSSGECFSGPAGGSGQVGATWGISTVTLYTNNGTPTSVQYFCIGI
jgi:hypothetical protein